MRLTIERGAALAAMARVQGAVLRNTTIPILEDVLLQAQDGRLTIVGSDANIETCAKAPATVDTSGAVAAPGHRFHDMLRNLPVGGNLELELKPGEHRLTVRCGRSRYQLPTLPAGDFPQFSTGGIEHQAELPAKALARLLGKTAFAISSEQTRYYMCGLHLHVVTVDGDRRLRAVATNGAALALADMDCPADWLQARGLTLPAKTVGELQGLLEGLAGDVNLWSNGSLVGIEAEVVRLASKLVDGNFPDYSRVIPPDVATPAKIDVGELIAALKRCAAFSSDKTQTLRLALEPDRLTVRARDGQGAEAEEVIEIDYAGSVQELGFAGKQLQPILAQIAGEQVVAHIGGPNDPAKFLDPTDPHALFICMPLRV